MTPEYRAKKMDSDEWVEGYYIPENPDRNSTIISIEKVGEEIIDGYMAWEEYGEINYTVDPNTLAIHFPNMIDKNGKKIFASLGDGGVGGDKYKNRYGVTSIAKVEGNGMVVPPFYFNFNDLEIIEIYKGKTND